MTVNFVSRLSTATTADTWVLPPPVPPNLSMDSDSIPACPSRGIDGQGTLVVVGRSGKVQSVCPWIRE